MQYRKKEIPWILNKTEILFDFDYDYEMYDLHSQNGQFSGYHFLITFLKAFNEISFLNSSGTIFQIFGPRNEILSVPLKTFLTFGKLNCENCR